MNLYQNKIIVFLFFTSNLCSEDSLIDKFTDPWNTLQDNDIKIYWQNIDDSPFCMAKKVYNHNSKKIKTILEQKEKYPEVFDRITYSKSITNDIVHIKLDLPFPFYGRDYIVKYNYFTKDKIEYFSYKATTEANIEVNNNYVRLINAEGLWRIESLSDNQTELTYIWNGELRGDFPDWALTKAWIEQGNEVFTWLKESLENY